MSENQSSYRQIIKATSLFGGVQIFNIVISILRSKIIAVLLGPLGMGISGLLLGTTGLMSSLTNFGLGSSAVKNIAEANALGDGKRIGVVITVFRRLVWITGLLGAILTWVFSSQLSQFTFGNKKYTSAFIWLSVTLLLNQLTSGQDVLLQGMRKLRHLAQANMIGSVVGLIIAVLIYKLYSIDGIVPALISVSFCNMIIVWVFSRQVKIKNVEVTFKETTHEGKDMLRMGFMLSLSTLINLATSYIVRIYISNTSGIEYVGLYNAGFSIITTYVGLVFSAMGTDYYPRLSEVAHNNEKLKELVNHQAEIAILILAPILSFFLIFINYIVTILYSEKFIPINGMLHWAALGMYFKAASWAISFVFLAKGYSKIFLINELIANLCQLILNILGYKFGGLTGMGVSFVVGYILYLFQMYFTGRFKCQFDFNANFYKIFLTQFLLGLACFFNVKFGHGFLVCGIGAILIIISMVFSIREVDKRIDLKSVFMKFKR